VTPTALLMTWRGIHNSDGGRSLPTVDHVPVAAESREASIIVRPKTCSEPRLAIPASLYALRFDDQSFRQLARLLDQSGLSNYAGIINNFVSFCRWPMKTFLSRKGQRPPRISGLLSRYVIVKSRPTVTNDNKTVVFAGREGLRIRRRGARGSSRLPCESPIRTSPASDMSTPLGKLVMAS